jgi:hypothetical protein
MVHKLVQSSFSLYIMHYTLILTSWLLKSISLYYCFLMDVGLIAAASKQLDTLLPDANGTHTINNSSPTRHLTANGLCATKPLQNGHVKKVTSNGVANGIGNYHANGNRVHK